MDGIHDLGGRHGFGKIDVNEPEVVFHEPYEGRVRAMVNAMTRASDWNLDWFRHCRELIAPEDYLSRPYFDQWAQTYCAMMINSGWANVEECATGKAINPVSDLPPPITAEQARGFILKEVRFDAEVSEQPIFKVSDKVRTVSNVTNGHTRLPLYARNRIGYVVAHHGAHIFPDDMAVNKKRHVHLYTIEFNASELWPEVTESIDTVSLDLWEEYLERV